MHLSNHLRDTWRRGLGLALTAVLFGACTERPTLVGELGEQRAGADRLLTVIGTGRVAMPPESATFDALVVSITASPSQGWTAGAATMGNVVRALEAAGVVPADLTLGEIDLEQRKDGSWSLSQRLRVGTRNLGELPDLMSIASTAGARVELHRFGIGDKRAAGDRARERALLDAEYKAEMIGRELRLRVVEVRAIEELPAGNPDALPEAGVYETTCALRITYVMAP
jgi:uncharacterized protein YggE